MPRSFHSRPVSERMTGDEATSSTCQADGTLNRLKAAIRAGVAECRLIPDARYDSWRAAGFGGEADAQIPDKELPLLCQAFNRATYRRPALDHACGYPLSLPLSRAVLPLF